MATFFAYQTEAQQINISPTPLRMDVIEQTGNAFKASEGGTCIKILQKGTLSINYNIVFLFPLPADTITYYATLNGKIIPGSIGQTSTPNNYSGVGTRDKQCIAEVKKGDVIEIIATSSTGMDEMWIPPVLTPQGTTERISGGFSVILFYSDCKPKSEK